MSFEVHDLQNRGEALRRHLGIDGTMGDAQDVPHPFHLDQASGACLVCGLGMAHRKHVALVPARHPGARPTGTGWPA